MRRAKDIMSAPVRTIGPDQTLGDAARLMLASNISCLPVTDERERVVGILTHSDFMPRPHHLPFSTLSHVTVLGHWTSYDELETSYTQAAKERVRDMMRKDVITVEEDTPLAQVAELMVRHNVKRLPVVRQRRLVGIVSRHDLLKMLSGLDDEG